MVNYDKLVRTRTKEFSSRKPVKKTDFKGLNGVAKVKFERKKNGVAKVKAKKRESAGGERKGGGERRVRSGEESDGDWVSGVDEGGSGEEVMWDSDGYSGSVDNNRKSGYQTRKGGK